MKVMFICGARLTENGLRCASWIKSLICGLPDDINVTVAGEGADVNSIIKCMAGDTEVSFFGFSVSGSECDFADIIKAVNPDATVIFGTEKTYTLFALNACKLAGIKGKTALFAQGIALACAKSYHEGVPHAIVRRWTFRDFARRSNILTEQKNMFISAAKEKQAIEKTEHFIGRTTLDNAVLRIYNPDAAYYKCNDVMRSVFYRGQWRYENCEKHRIFISQFYYPLKGFHYLLEAAAQLKNKYPGLKIAAAGYNPVLKAVDENEIKETIEDTLNGSLDSKFCKVHKHIEEAKDHLCCDICCAKKDIKKHIDEKFDAANFEEEFSNLNEQAEAIIQKLNSLT